MDQTDRNVATHPVASNVESVTRLEREFIKRRSVSEKLGSFITLYSGSLWMILLHALVFGGWIVVNTGLIRGIRIFDPFPFVFLTTAVSLEAIFLSFFVLMGQRA